MSASRFVYLYNMVGIVSCGVIITFQLLLLLSLGIKLHHKKIDVGIKLLTYGGFASLVVAYTMLLLSRASYLWSPDSEQWRTFWIFYMSFGGIATVLMYLYLLARLYKTYKDTSYEVKRWVIQMHLIIACAALIGMISVPFVGQISETDIWFINLIISILMLTIGACHLIYLFNRHLFEQLLAHRAKLTESQRKGHENHMSVELQVIQLDLLGTIRKHSLLGVTILLSTFLATFTPWISTFIEGDTGIFWIIWYPLHGIWINIAGLSLYLGFAVNCTHYDKMCCLCDRGCDSLCTAMAKQSLRETTSLTSLSSLDRV